jgi:integrase
MARRRKGPWLRTQDNSYCTTVGRKIVRLGSAGDPWDQIEKAYHAAHGESNGKRPALRIDRVADEFLDYVRENWAERTFEWYNRFIPPFVKFVGPMRLADLTPKLVGRWVRRQPAGSQHAAARAVARLCNWAVDERLIAASPIKGYVKPQPNNREFTLTDAQYFECLAHTKQPFLDVMQFMWTTGCRPQEVRQIQAAWIDGDKIVFPRVDSKGDGKRRKKRRVIYLTDAPQKIVQRLAEAFPQGSLFRDSNGQPWTRNGINKAVRRLRQAIGITELVPYTFRHTWITNMLKAGVDVATVAALAGNSVKTILLHYEHVARDDDHLRAAVKRSNGGSPAVTDTQPAAQS